MIRKVGPAASVGAMDINDLGLPGLTSRPLHPTDAVATYRLVAEVELLDAGEVMVEQGDIVADWQRPSFTLETQSLGVLDGGVLVAIAEVSRGRRAEAAVHPGHRGRGIGTALAGWTERVSRRDGTGLVGQTAILGSPAERLFRQLGYESLWTSWVLRMPEGTSIQPQATPTGYTIRTADGEADHRAAHTVLEDAFLEWSDRARETFEDFVAGTLLRPGFAPWNLAPHD